MGKGGLGYTYEDAECPDHAKPPRSSPSFFVLTRLVLSCLETPSIRALPEIVNT